jgi:hypothetical protein
MGTTGAACSYEGRTAVVPLTTNTAWTIMDRSMTIQSTDVVHLTQWHQRYMLYRPADRLALYLRFGEFDHPMRAPWLLASQLQNQGQQNWLD